MQISKNVNNIEWVIEEVSKIVPRDRVLRFEPLKAYTTFKVGGPATALVKVNTERELSRVLRLLIDTRTKHMLIGNGSNLLVSDAGYKGIVLKLEGDFDAIERDEDTITVGCAKLLSATSAFATAESLTGFEFASGIPGTVGGAVYMNAGAYGGEMKDVVTEVRVMSPDGYQILDMPADEMEFSYRHSILEENGWVALSVKIKLEPGNQEEIKARVLELAGKRNEKQPVNFPSAGSTFKRPVGGFAAALIDEAGLKGAHVGDAEVSTKHAGFVINKGDATCDDILELMRIVVEKVYENSGIRLEPEVRIIGEEL